MSDPILLFLTLDAGALLLLGLAAAALPAAAATFLAAIASGLGTLLCLAPLLLRAPATTFDLPVGPPGLSLHLAFDPLAAFFLTIVFVAGTALTAFHETTRPRPGLAQIRMTTFALAGATLTLLAADAVSLAIGLAIIAAAPARRAALLAPILLLTAICLLTPAGFAPRFDTIRVAPVEPIRIAAADALTFAAVAALIGIRPAERSPTADAIAAGIVIPISIYLLLRIVADLPATAIQIAAGFILLLAGAAVAVIEAWRAAAHPEIDTSVACLARRQAGIAVSGIGLALIARSSDLPNAESVAFAAALLTSFTSSVAGVVTALATHVIAAAAGTCRLSRLGGLIHTMPATAAALCTGLLGLSALPPSLGFAALWLLFEAILSAPRTGGLLFQLPLALTGAALAVSAALATASVVRLIGVPLLGRPRTPRGAGAREDKSAARAILPGLAGVSLVAGIMPGLTLWLLAGPALRSLTGSPYSTRFGLPLLASSGTSPTYLALPVLALLTLATGAAIMVPRWSRKATKPAGAWIDGMQPPVGLPFGEPAAQSTGRGFVPTLPHIPVPALPQIPRMPALRPPSAAAGLWLLLGASGLLLLALALVE